MFSKIGDKRRKGINQNNNSNNKKKFVKKASYDKDELAVDRDQFEKRFQQNSDSKFDNVDKDDITDSVQEQQAKQRKELEEKVDAKFGFEKYAQSTPKLGWLFNMRTTTVDDEDGPDHSAVDYYFIDTDGEHFKTTIKYEPYCYIGVRDQTENIVEHSLKKRFEDLISRITLVEKEDLALPNHLSGKLAKYLKLSFRNIKNFLEVRKFILPLVEKNSKLLQTGVDEVIRDDILHTMMHQDDDDEPAYMEQSKQQQQMKKLDFTECILDIREYDVQYHIRTAIDMDIRVGYWYEVFTIDGESHLNLRRDLEERAIPKVCAFDIETTKAPLMFPDPNVDSIMMISYMIDGQGYLIVNREVVSEDIEDFEYTPKPEYPGPFTVFNEANELELLRKWFDHMQETKPVIYVTYNGDFFDWPFIERRAKHHGLSMREEIGYYFSQDIYRSTYGVHMDCFCWVKRDSYLPHGHHGLKAVTRAKLGYNPVEIDPEEMVPFAREKPQTLAAYSVSDAVATYFLYMKYVNPFIFSLCNIIPMPPDDVLRKGSGTLCETLLMVQAYKASIIAPNRYHNDPEKMYKGHLLDSETYIGGHVEALRSGIYRNDLDQEFDVNPNTYQQLINNVDKALTFAMEVEQKVKKEDVVDFEQVKQSIIKALEGIRDRPKRVEKPKIYHLDVGAMYPNIILTNRLQPTAIVDETVCANCVHNTHDANCKRIMDWHYRAEFYNITASEYFNIKRQVQSEKFAPKFEGGNPRNFEQLSQEEQQNALKKRINEYSRKVYKKIYEKESQVKQATICQRENPFYVDTVRTFRDRRYEYKEKLKTWQKNLRNASSVDKTEQAKNMIVMYDSLQVAHKCILNSFYGYVMRKAARWYSMEMAGVVTYCGAQIIKLAKDLVDEIGIPLELDTDGIWCMLPSSFPENFALHTKDGRTCVVSYPCFMLNADVNEKFTNHQYQDLVDPKTRSYVTHSECSIFFEVDGPHKAMILPASKEEGKGIKKRYAVFNEDGSIAELKGFEMKRRGELKLIKQFQETVFQNKYFLQGATLEAAFDSVASVANRFLDILYTKGADVEDEELFDLLTESSNMSKTLKEYGDQKSARITTAKRLAELFGDQMIKEKGLVCNYIVSKRPDGAAITERVIPVIIFQKEPEICLSFLRKWLKDGTINSTDMRQIIDWDYYIERLNSCIQKIVTIPAALQGINNPVPRVKHPEWLNKKLRAKNDKKKQISILSMVQGKENELVDLENIANVEPFKKRSFDLISNNSIEKESKNTELDDEERRTIVKVDKTSLAVKKLAKVFKDSTTPLDASFFEDDNFDDWLVKQKQSWKERRERRKRLQKGEANEDDIVAITTDRRATSTLTSYVRQSNMVLKHCDWDILQIRATDTPGILKLFVLVNKSIYTVLVNVPRTIYVNFYKSPSTGEKKITKSLPRAQACLHLVQKEIPESNFQSELTKIKSLNKNEELIQGVYESQIPPEYRSILELGNTCAVKKESKDKIGTNQTLQWNDLISKKNEQYLDHHEEVLKKIFVYSCTVDLRGVFAVFFFATKQAKIIVVQPYDQAEKPHLSLDKLMQECNEKVSLTQPLQFQFEISYVKTKALAWKQLDKELDMYKKELRGPTVLLIKSNQSLEQISSVQEFPSLSLAFPVEDAQQFPALNWIPFIVKRMIQRLFLIPSAFSDYLSWSHYLQVPLCNVGMDKPLYAMDVLFSRKLITQNHLLWYSDLAVPDLGGMEEESFHTDQEVSQQLEINHSGMYRNVCVELQIQNLLINSILQSKYVNEVDKSTIVANADVKLLHKLEKEDKMEIEESGIVEENRVQSFYDETVLTSQVLEQFKYLIADWIKDAQSNHQKKKTIPSILLQHLYRYLNDSTSKLYDPCLQLLVFKMMKIVYLHLMAQLKKFNCQIVYSNFNKVILHTNKQTAKDALQHVQYICNTLQQQNALFKSLHLQVKQVWSHLLWMDLHNYSGIVLPQQQSEESQKTSLKIIANWNLSTFLHSSSMNQRFEQYISQYLSKQFVNQQEMLSKQQTEEEIVQMQQQSVNKLLEQLTLQLLEQLPQIHQQEYENNLQHTLLFVNSLCAALSVDAMAMDSVNGIMKKSALKWLHVREFSQESRFVNPCKSFVLHNIICTQCNTCSDIDLLRDSNALQSLSQQQTNRNILHCEHCHSAYEMSVLEAKLVQVLQRRINTYQLQDLKCNRCHQIKAEFMNDRCSCSGKFECVETQQSLKQVISLLQSIAKVYKMEWLQETIASL